MIDSGAISGKIGKEVFPVMFEKGESPKSVVERLGLAQVSDSGAVAEVVSQALAANAKQADEYRAGNERVLQYLVGQVMKLSRGRVNPQLAIAELKKQLGK